MTVINPNSISGITSITLPSGDSNVLTVHTNDGVERFRIDSSGNVKVGTAATISPDGDLFVTGVCTATTLAGSGANLTNLPAANVTGTLPAISGANLTSLTAGNLTGALPAISGANLTGIAATDNVRTGILDVAGIATFRSDVNIPNINGGQVGGRRNIFMNGAMTVNQRESTTGLSYFNPVTSSIYTLDRWTVFNGNSFDTDSAQITKSTQSPDGFSSSMKWDIGNTETPSSNQNCGIEQKIEGQDLQGLAYGTSSAKTMTLSFHVYSNKTGTYCVQLLQPDGTKYQLHEYTVSSSNTWEKKTITVVGNTSDAINDDNTVGMRILWHLTCGSSQTESAASTWTGSGGGQFAATSNQVNLWDNASNHWYLTGCQLEIGTTATEFEYRSFGDELSLCERYYQLIMQDDLGGGGRTGGVGGTPYTDSSSVYCPILYRCRMRTKPTLESTASSTFRTRRGNSVAFNGFSGFNDAGDHSGTIITNGNAGGGDIGAYIWIETNSGGKVAMTAEL